MAEPGGRAVPTFKIGARGLIARVEECVAAKEVRAFRVEHELCRQDRLVGGAPRFPHGTYGMRVFHDVQVAPPLPDAIVSQPRPLLEDVRRDIAGEKSAGGRVDVVEDVRAAWSEEASEVAAVDELDFAAAAAPRTTSSASSRASSSSDASSTSNEPRPEPEVRHRFDREPRDGAPHARRLIVQRDRRRGRPPNQRGGADPPS